MRRVRVLAVVVLLAGCGGDGAAPEAGTSPATEAGATHIHGVGVNPADGAVIIATHSGLFRAAPGRQEARRVGDRRQDTMGFTVVGPDSFLGSGHPDPRDELPPVLGLIRSVDAGRTWQPVSLLGEADFHVLRAAGSRVYGVDSRSGLLLTSRDRGRTWRQRTPPAAVFDLAVDPEDPDHLVAAGEQGLFDSRDGGRRWRPLVQRRTGLLAWPDRLLLFEADGTVSAGADGGRRWRPVGRLPGQPAATSAHEGVLVAALHDKAVHISEDGGRTWRLRATAP